MNDEMRAQLTDFAAEFIAEAEQRAKEVFEKQIDIARIQRSRKL